MTKPQGKVPIAQAEAKQNLILKTSYTSRTLSDCASPQPFAPYVPSFP